MYCSVVITAVLGAIVAYLMHLLLTLNSNYWKKRGVPSLPTMPLFGVMFDVILQRKGLTEVVDEIYAKLDGKKFGGYLQFTSPVLMVRDLDLINRVLVKDFIHFEDRGPAWPKHSTDLFSVSIPNLTGDDWRISRHKLTPTFTSGKLKIMFNAIDICSNEVVTHIDKNLNQDFDAKDLSFRFLINTIASVAFGIKINTLEDDRNSDFYRESSKFFKPSFTFLMKMSAATFIPQILKYFTFNMLEKCVDDYFRKLTKDMIKYRESTGTRKADFLQIMLDQRKKKELINNMSTSNDNSIIYKDDVDDPDDKELLEQLKNTPAGSGNWDNSKELFTEDFIAAQTFLFISGGSETTATILNFVLYELAINQECQGKAQQEIDSVLSSNELTYQAIQKITYLDQFINETVRHNPLGGAMFRMCTKEYNIPDTDVIIEKGTFLSIPIGALHKDPQYFSEPEKFDPDRFEDMNTIPKGAFLNFGIGPRMCIAKRLAMLEMKIYLVRILTKYDIILSKKTKLPLKPVKNSIILTIEGGIWVKFVKRRVV